MYLSNSFNALLTLILMGVKDDSQHLPSIAKRVLSSIKCIQSRQIKTTQTEHIIYIGLVI